MYNTSNSSILLRHRGRGGAERLASAAPVYLRSPGIESHSPTTLQRYIYRTVSTQSDGPAAGRWMAGSWDRRRSAPVAAARCAFHRHGFNSMEISSYVTSEIRLFITTETFLNPQRRNLTRPVSRSKFRSIRRPLIERPRLCPLRPTSVKWYDHLGLINGCKQWHSANIRNFNTEQIAIINTKSNARRQV